MYKKKNYLIFFLMPAIGSTVNSHKVLRPTILATHFRVNGSMQATTLPLDTAKVRL